MEHTPGRVKLVWLICPLCKDRFPTKPLFVSHQINKHSTELKNSIKKTISSQSSGQTTETIFLRGESGQTVQLKVMKKSPNTAIKNPVETETENQSQLVNQIKKENNVDEVEIIDEKPNITKQKQDDDDSKDKLETRNTSEKTCKEYEKQRNYSVERLKDPIPMSAFPSLMKTNTTSEMSPMGTLSTSYLSSLSPLLKSQSVLPRLKVPAKNAYGPCGAEPFPDPTLFFLSYPEYLKMSALKSKTYSKKISSRRESKNPTGKQESSPTEITQVADSKIETPMALQMMKTKLPENFTRKSRPSPISTPTTTTKTTTTTTYYKPSSSSSYKKLSRSPSPPPLELPSLKAIAVELAKRASNATSSSYSSTTQNQNEENNKHPMDIKSEIKYEVPGVEVILEEPEDEFSDPFQTNETQNQNDNNISETNSTCRSEEYLYCSNCLQNFKSQAKLDCHLLSCSWGNNDLEDENDEDEDYNFELGEFNDNYTNNFMEHESSDYVQNTHNNDNNNYYNNKRNGQRDSYINEFSPKKPRKEPGEVSPPPPPKFPVIIPRRKKVIPPQFRIPSAKQLLRETRMKNGTKRIDESTPNLVKGPNGKLYFVKRKNNNNNNNNNNNKNNNATPPLPPRTYSRVSNNNNSNTTVSSSSTNPQPTRRIAFRCVTCSSIFLTLSDLKAHKVIHSSAPRVNSVVNAS